MTIKILGFRKDCFKAIINGKLYKFPTEEEFFEFLEEMEL